MVLNSEYRERVEVLPCFDELFCKYDEEVSNFKILIVADVEINILILVE